LGLGSRHRLERRGGETERQRAEDSHCAAAHAPRPPKLAAGGIENERDRNSTSAQSFGWAVTEDREGATPAARGRGSDEVLEHPDLEVGDPSQFPIIAQKRGGSLFQAGGDLQRVGRAEAVLGSQLSRATRCRPVKRGDNQVGIVGQEDLVFLRDVWSPHLQRLDGDLHERQDGGHTREGASSQLVQSHPGEPGELRRAFDVVDEDWCVEPDALVLAEGGG
jgi:hypothetical protein